MKRIFNLMVIVSMVFTLTTLFSGCFSSKDDSSGGGDTIVTDDGNGDGTGIGVSRVSVSDSTGTFIGYSLSTTRYQLTLMNSSGYMYNINWDGTLSEDQIFFSSGDCSGTPYISDMSAPDYGKSVIFNSGQVYRPVTLNADGTTTMISVTFNSDKLDSSCNSPSFGSSGIELEATTRSAVGIPDTITPPFTFDFGN